MAIGVNRFPMNTDELDFGDENLDWGDTGISGLTSTSSSSSGAGSLLNAQTNKAKFEAEQAAAKAAAELARLGAQRTADYYRNILGQGAMNIGGLTEQIGEQERAGQQYIADQYDMLSRLLGERRGQAEQLQTQGFNALQTYLGQNPMQAYAQAQNVMPTVTQNALTQYMQSRGLETAPTQEATDILNAQLAGGAANYNQLLNVLRASETQQQQSRAAEEQMARTLAGANLGAIYGTATSNLEQTRLAALADLASRVQAARLQAERDRLAREQAIQDAIAKVLGTGTVAPTETEIPVTPATQPGSGTTAPGDTRSRAERVTTAGREFSSFKEAVKALNPQAVAEFTKDGSGLSAKEIAELKRRNPKLAAQF